MRVHSAQFIHGALCAALACALGLGLAACERAPGSGELAPRAGAAQRVASSESAPGTTFAAARSSVDDKTLAVNVKAALMAAAALKATTIDVSAQDGVVTLSGTTDTSTRRDLAAYLALRVDGVVSVRNRIAIVANS
jgi:osmotically-inducible protein OsmY